MVLSQKCTHDKNKLILISTIQFFVCSCLQFVSTLVIHLKFSRVMFCYLIPTFCSISKVANAHSQKFDCLCDFIKKKQKIITFQICTRLVWSSKNIHSKICGGPWGIPGKFDGEFIPSHRSNKCAKQSNEPDIRDFGLIYRVCRRC